MSRLRVAVVGAGLIGPRHAKTVSDNPDAELIAIVDPLQGGADLAAQYSTAHYRSVAELVQSESHKPDAAIICTPNHTHVPIARDLAAAGVHVLIEKPFSTDVASGRALLADLAASGVRALVGHHRRFNPYMVAAKRVLASRTLGDVIAVNGLWALCKPPAYFDPPADWRRDRASGGVVLINMIHEVDLLHHLLGPITTVHAEKVAPRRGFDAEEGAALTLRFASGAVGTFLVADNAPSPYNFEAGTGENPLIPRSGQDFYRIFGTDGSLSVPDMTIWSYRDVPKSWNSELARETVPVPDGVPFDLQLQHFVKVVRGEEEPSCTAQAGLAALIVCDAIREALDGNSTVRIEPYSL